MFWFRKLVNYNLWFQFGLPPNGAVVLVGSRDSCDILQNGVRILCSNNLMLNVDISARSKVQNLRCQGLSVPVVLIDLKEECPVQPMTSCFETEIIFYQELHFTNSDL